MRGGGGVGYFSLFIGILLASPATAEEAMVAVASNFIKPMAALEQGFEERTGHRLAISYGSSGRLFAQITNGAPFDVFLSADREKADSLYERGLTLFPPADYAVGRLVLWSNDARMKPQGFESLTKPDVDKIAMANPRLAPYGLAAQQTMESAGLFTQLRQKLVMGENIAQAYQFTYTGNAQLGFVALSQVLSSVRQQDYWLVPAEFHEPIYQSAVLLSRASRNVAAREFFDYLLEPASAELIASFGYDLNPTSENVP